MEIDYRFKVKNYTIKFPGRKYHRGRYESQEQKGNPGKLFFLENLYS